MWYNLFFTPQEVQNTIHRFSHGVIRTLQTIWRTYSLQLTQSRFCSCRSCRFLPRLLARDENACEYQSQAANGIQTHWLVEQQRAIEERHTGEKIGNDERARRLNCYSCVENSVYHREGSFEAFRKPRVSSGLNSPIF